MNQSDNEKPSKDVAGVDSMSPKEIIGTSEVTATESATIPATSKRSIEQLEIQDEPVEDDVVYPSGWRLWLAFTSLCIVSLLYGFNLAIVAAAIPSLTDYFKSIDEIGWYSSAYSLMTASFTIAYGKLYSQTSAKKIYITSISIFELGSVLCTVAQNSPMFIFGRAVVGIGAAGVGSGSYVILSQLFPRSRRPVWITVMSSAQMIGIVGAPLIGGGLIDWIGWRGCFGFSIPLGVVAIALVTFGYHDNVPHEDDELPWRVKVKRFDWISVLLMLPAFTSLLLALQWGGIKYRWSDARIVVLFVLSVVLISIFGYRQYRLQDKATLPPRIIKMRSVLAACWFNSCTNSSLTVTEYYMSIFFQGVKGYTASQSGIHMTPLLVCITIGSLCGGLGVKWLGYYNPFMIATTLLAPVAAGLLTTIRLNDSSVKILCELGFLGAAVGIGLQAPIIALQTTMAQRDIPIAISSTVMASTLATSVWVVVSASLFTNRLREELAAHSPSVDVAPLLNAGLSEIREIVGSARLNDVLLGYDAAVTQTLYLPVALLAATVIASALIKWQPIKKKQK